MADLIVAGTGSGGIGSSLGHHAKGSKGADARSKEEITITFARSSVKGLRKTVG